MCLGYATLIQHKGFLAMWLFPREYNIRASQQLHCNVTYAWEYNMWQVTCVWKVSTCYFTFNVLAARTGVPLVKIWKNIHSSCWILISQGMTFISFYGIKGRYVLWIWNETKAQRLLFYVQCPCCKNWYFPRKDLENIHSSCWIRPN